MTPDDLQDFAGVWRLERRIEDQLAGSIGHARGQAVLRRDGDRLIYDETITLDLPGQRPLEGNRRYLWSRTPGGIAVHFADGQPFHRITLDTAAPQAAHWCDPDQYDVRYDLADWPSWTSIWKVRGPRKDYAMQTVYVPEAQAREGLALAAFRGMGQNRE